MKRTKSVLASLMLAAVMLGQSAAPVMAASPTFDITGVWKLNTGETFQIFQAKDEVNGVYVNGGFAHQFQGRYVSQTKIKFILIRRTRANNCEVTMEGEINLSSANSISFTSFPLETGCGISVGQSYPGTYVRVL
jgi:hypothetical protein